MKPQLGEGSQAVWETAQDDLSVASVSPSPDVVILGRGFLHLPLPPPIQHRWV